MKHYLSILSFFILVTVLFSCGVSKKRTKYVKNNFKELKEAFPEAQVTIVKDSIKLIFPNNVMFEVGSSTILKGFETKIERFASIMKKYGKTNLLITGFTDNSGEAETNLRLSLERAQGVKDYLLKSNVNEKRLFTWGLGEKSPIASNSTPEGKSKNRRVEFVVLYKP